MIDERMEELAGLYVLEALTPAERTAFESALARDPELHALVASLRTARDAMAGAIPAATPSPKLKQRIMAELALRERQAPALPARRLHEIIGFWLSWLVTAAAAFALVAGYREENGLKSQLQMATTRANQLNEMANRLRDRADTLQESVAALQETNRLANVRIALLGSLLADSPKAIAVSLWDNERQSGIFVAQNLKPLPADRDYQLWVIDPKYKIPVSAGVFQVDQQGNLRIQFKADKTIVTADKFAVTLEPKGGLPTPTLKNLVLLGG